MRTKSISTVFHVFKLLLTMVYKRISNIFWFDHGGIKEKENQLQKTAVLTRES